MTGAYFSDDEAPTLRKMFEEGSIDSDEYPEFSVNDPLGAMIRKCWSVDPKQRPTMMDIYHQVRILRNCGALADLRNPFIQLLDAPGRSKGLDRLLSAVKEQASKSADWLREQRSRAKRHRISGASLSASKPLDASSSGDR